MEDGNMSEICTALMNEVGGKAIKSDDPFWSTVGFPPYHYNCRTTFRAVYDYELDEGEIDLAVPKESAPLDNGFGGNPLEKEGWWKITPGMIERADKYGLRKKIESFAQKIGIENYDMRLVKGFETRKLEGTSFKANLVKGANPQQKEIAIAKTLYENGYDVLFTPENTFVQGIKNPDGLIKNLNKVIELKEIDSDDKAKISDKIKEAVKQKADIVVLNFDYKTNYTKQEAIKKASDTIHVTIPEDIRGTDKNNLTAKQKKSLQEKIDGLQKLKEVWVIWNGQISKIIK